ncbi:response regulator [Rheinheimera sp.]|uniref:response regulator n=1 Tax=Rheinheimera sp. TaxID=1869214 RepID=UPI00307F7E19
MTSSWCSALIIDDTAAVRSYLCQILKHLGVGPVYEAADGYQGSLLFNQHKPHMVFLDIQLPDVNGRQLLRQLKQQQPDCQVFICSAYSSVENLKDAVAGGAGAFIVKPFASERIHQVVQPVLKASRLSLPG